LVFEDRRAAAKSRSTNTSNHPEPKNAWLGSICRAKTLFAGFNSPGRSPPVEEDVPTHWGRTADDVQRLSIRHARSPTPATRPSVEILVRLAAQELPAQFTPRMQRMSLPALGLTQGILNVIRSDNQR